VQNFQYQMAWALKGAQPHITGFSFCSSTLIGYPAYASSAHPLCRVHTVWYGEYWRKKAVVLHRCIMFNWKGNILVLILEPVLELLLGWVTSFHRTQLILSELSKMLQFSSSSDNPPSFELYGMSQFLLTHTFSKFTLRTLLPRASVMIDFHDQCTDGQMLFYVLQTDKFNRFFPTKFLVLVSLPIRNHNMNSYWSYWSTTPPQNFISVLFLA